jgi:hypothetical protein
MVAAFLCRDHAVNIGLTPVFCMPFPSLGGGAGAFSSRLGPGPLNRSLHLAFPLQLHLHNAHDPGKGSAYNHP